MFSRHFKALNFVLMDKVRSMEVLEYDEPVALDGGSIEEEVLAAVKGEQTFNTKARVTISRSNERKK